MSPDELRELFDPEKRRERFEAWKASLRNPILPPPPEGMDSPIYVIDPESRRLMDILDLGSKQNCNGGWDGYCGGCDGCLYLQAVHADCYEFLNYEDACRKYPSAGEPLR